MGAVTTKKKSNAGKNVFVFFLVFIILEMLIIFGISKVFKNKDVTPSIFGYSIFMTKEDLYKKGDEGIEIAVPKNVLVIASNGLPDPTNKIGTAVLCEEVEEVGTGVFYLASVDPLADQTGVVYTVANGEKYYTVKSSNLVGSTTSYYKTAGTVINFVTKKFGVIVCAVVPVFLMVFLELIIAIATHSSDDDDYDDEDEEEEEERRDVKLDDFLFGGQNEGEQIAKQRRQQQNRKGGSPVKSAKTVDFDDFAPPKRQQKPQQAQANKPQQTQAKAQPQQAKPQQGAPANRPAQKAEPQTARFEKPQAAAPQQRADIHPAPAQTAPPPMPARAQAAPAQQAAPAPQAAVEESAAPAPKPRRRRRLSSASSGSSTDASLEELMKLMEEEQNKLQSK